MDRQKIIQAILSEIPEEVKEDEITVRDFTEEMKKEGRKMTQRAAIDYLKRLVEEKKLTMRQARKNGRPVLAFRSVNNDTTR